MDNLTKRRRKLIASLTLTASFVLGGALVASPASAVSNDADAGGLAVMPPDYCDTGDYNTPPGDCTQGDPLHNGYILPRFMYDGTFPDEMTVGEELDLFYSSGWGFLNAQANCAAVDGDFLDEEIGPHTFVNYRGDKVTKNGRLCHNVNADPSTAPSAQQVYGFAAPAHGLHGRFVGYVYYGGYWHSCYWHYYFNSASVVCQ